MHRQKGNEKMHASAQRAKNILVEDLTETFTRPPEA